MVPEIRDLTGGIKLNSPLALGSHDGANHFAMIHFEAFAAGIFEFVRIQPKLMKDCGMDVRDVVPVFNGMEPKLVRNAMGGATFDAAAGEPCAEALRMMVTSAAFRPRRTA